MKRQDIFTIIGCFGVIGTAVMAVYDNKRAAKKEVKHRWMNYIPTGVISLLTMGGIIASNRFSAADLAGLAGTTAYILSNRKKLEGKLREAVGEEAYKETKKEAVRHFAAEALKHHQTIEETGTGDVLCIEGYSGRIFRASTEHVDQAIEQFKQYYKDNYCCCFNDFYRFLKIEQTHFGHQFGYVNSEDWYSEDGLTIYTTYLPVKDQEDSAPYHEDIYVIDFDSGSYPMECWQEY